MRVGFRFSGWELGTRSRDLRRRSFPVMRVCRLRATRHAQPGASVLTLEARSTGFEPVTSGVTVDVGYHPEPTHSVQAIAAPRDGRAHRRADARSGRVKTARHVPLMSPNLLSVRDVADSLRVHRSTVYSLCDRGELEHARVGNVIRIRPEVLEAFLRRGSSPGPPRHVCEQRG